MLSNYSTLLSCKGFILILHQITLNSCQENVLVRRVIYLLIKPPCFALNESFPLSHEIIPAWFATWEFWIWRVQKGLDFKSFSFLFFFFLKYQRGVFSRQYLDFTRILLELP